ncbi:hypothetical protein Tco_1341285 [Tanacetum coccineum]
MLSRLWMSWCRNGDDDAVDSVVGWGVVAVVKMAVEARGIVDRLDPVKRSIFEVGRRTRRKVIPAIGDGGRTWEGRERGEVVCVCIKMEMK